MNIDSFISSYETWLFIDSPDTVSAESSESTSIIGICFDISATICLGYSAGLIFDLSFWFCIALWF